MIIIMEENMFAIRDRKTFYLDLDCSKNVDQNFKHETELS